MGIAFAFVFSSFSSTYINTNTIPKCGLIHHNNHKNQLLSSRERKKEKWEIWKRQNQDSRGSVSSVEAVPVTNLLTKKLPFNWVTNWYVLSSQTYIYIYLHSFIHTHILSFSQLNSIHCLRPCCVICK